MLALGLGVIWLWRHRAAPPYAPGKVAVLPFIVRGSPQLAYLGEGMVDLLSTNLSGSGVRAVDPHALLAFLKRETPADPDRARDVAAHFGAATYVLGTVVEIDRRLRVMASLYDDGTLLAEVRTEGDANKLFDLIDQLTAQLHRPLTTRGEAARVAPATTANPGALRDYLQGEQYLRQGWVKKAEVAFRNAVEKDSSFALAWYRLAVATTWVGGLSTVRAREASQRALALDDRLSGQDRERVLAVSALIDGRWRAAEEIYRRIVSAHSDDVDAWYMLGETILHYAHFTGRAPADARGPFERVVLLDPLHGPALGHLADLARLEHRPAELLVMLERLVRVDDEPDPVLNLERAVLRGEKADADRFLGAIGRGELGHPRMAFRNVTFLPDNLATAGRIARIGLDESAPRDWYIAALRRDVMLDLAHGRLRRGLARARELRASTDRMALRGQIAFAKGRYSEAQMAFDRMRSEISYDVNWISFPGDRAVRIELLRRAGKLEEALAWTNALAMNSYEVAFLAPRALARARIEEELARREEAAADYTRVVELWKDCDSELRSEFEDARRGVERVRQQLSGGPAR